MFTQIAPEDTKRIAELQKLLDLIRQKEAEIVRELRALVYKIER